MGVFLRRLVFLIKKLILKKKSRERFTSIFNYDFSIKTSLLNYGLRVN